MSEQMSAKRTGTGPEEPPERRVSPWAVGFTIFAGVMMMMVGIFQVVQGLAALIEDTFYVAAPNYVYEFDVTAWGWIHLLLGVLVGAAGIAVLSGRPWARAVGIVFAVLNAISQFFFIPYYPLWSLTMIALDVAVIWALCVYGRREAEQVGY